MAVNGKRLPAIDVFSKALAFLADKLTTFIRTTLEGGKDVLEQSGIQWVITVPAIWSPRARQFMRKAAYKVYLSPNYSKLSELIVTDASSMRVNFSKESVDS